MDFATFLNAYGLPILLAALLIFMFWSSRRRSQKQKLAQEEKARQTVPGVEVLLQGGIYGTIVEYDSDNLDQPALVEVAEGTVIKVHSQAILRIVPASDDLASDEDVVDEDTVGDTDDETLDDEIAAISGDDELSEAVQRERETDKPDS